MRILLQSRATLFSVPGGDTIQILKTAEALRAAGCAAVVATDLEPDLSGYDMVHLFNLTRPQEVYLQARNAKRQRKKVALSPIYVEYAEYDRKGRTGLGRLAANALASAQTEYLKVLARAMKNGEINKGTGALLARGYARLQRSIVELTDVVLPNSESEMRRVVRAFPISGGKPCVVVPNAVDARVFNAGAGRAAKAPEAEGSVLCVARIEGRKCQLNLVRAMRDLPWRLVLVGKPAPNHLAYFRRVEGEAGPNTEIIGQIDHDALPAFYAAARVHALVSWMETPGLSSLEAAAMGCAVVVTDRGDTRDYFGDRAFYCEPDSVESIRRAIRNAYAAPRDPELATHVLENFTWEKAVEKTLEGYLLASQGTTTRPPSRATSTPSTSSAV